MGIQQSEGNSPSFFPDKMLWHIQGFYEPSLWSLFQQLVQIGGRTVLTLRPFCKAVLNCGGMRDPKPLWASYLLISLPYEGAWMASTSLTTSLHMFHSLYPFPPLLMQWEELHSWSRGKVFTFQQDVSFWEIAFNFSFPNSCSYRAMLAIHSAECRGRMLVFSLEDSASSSSSLWSTDRFPWLLSFAFISLKILQLFHLSVWLNLSRVSHNSSNFFLAFIGFLHSSINKQNPK